MKNILSLDVGEARIGVPIGYEETKNCFPLQAIKKSESDIKIKNIINEKQISLLVVGLPLDEDNNETTTSQKIRLFANKLSNENNYLLNQKISGSSDVDLTEIKKKLEKIESNLKIMYENMEILSKNNENMKEDITKTFSDLHKWQEDLVVNVNKGLDELQTKYSNQHSQLYDEIQTLHKKNDNKNEFIKIEHSQKEETKQQNQQSLQAQQNQIGVVPNNGEVNLLDDWSVN